MSLPYCVKQNTLFVYGFLHSTILRICKKKKAPLFFLFLLGLSKKRPLLEASPISENLVLCIFTHFPKNACIFQKCTHFMQIRWKMHAFSLKMRAFRKTLTRQGNFLVFFVVFVTNCFTFVIHSTRLVFSCKDLKLRRNYLIFQCYPI